MSLCACGHDFTDHYQTDVEYLCILCSWCDGYTKAAANDSATAPVPAGGTPEGLAREKVEMTDSEVKPSSPTTEAGYNVAEADLRDAIYRLPRGRFSMLADLDAALQQAREGVKVDTDRIWRHGYAQGHAEGRREATVDCNQHVSDSWTQGYREGRREAVRYLHYRGTGKWPSEAGVVAALDGIDRVAGLEGEGRSPIGSNASESPPRWEDGEPFPMGDASESPPTLTRCPHCDGGGCAVCFGTGQTERDASESGQPQRKSLALALRESAESDREWFRAVASNDEVDYDGWASDVIHRLTPYELGVGVHEVVELAAGGYRPRDASESPPTRCGCQCHGPYVWDICPHCRPDLLGDASESPPPEPHWSDPWRPLPPIPPIGDASESGQPLEASDE